MNVKTSLFMKAKTSLFIRTKVYFTTVRKNLPVPYMRDMSKVIATIFFSRILVTSMTKIKHRDLPEEVLYFSTQSP